jgi:iron complex transport system substrate-binding protein
MIRRNTLFPALALFAFVALAALLGACGRGPTAPTTQPGSTTSVASVPNDSGPRLVSTVPAATLILVQLGAVDRLVGISTYDRLVLPPDQRDLPIVGDYESLNFETLLAQHPTALVVQTADTRLSPRLKQITEDNRIALVNIRMDTIDDLYAATRMLGAASGRQKTAEHQIALVRAQLAALSRRLHDVPRRKVLYIIGKNPIWIVGADRFMDEMIQIAGGTNVGRQVGTDFPQVSRETITVLGPEVLLIAAPGEPAPRTSNDPSDPRIAGWMNLDIPATARTGAGGGRVYVVTGANSQLCSLDLPQMTLDLARLIHPELTDLPASIDTLPLPAASAPATGGASGGGR